MGQPRINEQQQRLAHSIGFFIDCVQEEKWLMNGAKWIGPDGATDCEMRLWAALEEYDRKAAKPAVSPHAQNDGSSGNGTGGRPGDRTTVAQASHGTRYAILAASSSIERLDLPLRTSGKLQKHGILTIDLLTQKTGRMLRRLPGIGLKSVDEIQTALIRHGLSLSD